MIAYQTLTEGLADLKQRGFTVDFNLAFDRVVCRSTGIFLYPADFEIVEMHHFDGQTDPGDDNILYAISSKDQRIKGVLVSAYGVYSEDMDAGMLKKLTIHTTLN